MNKAKFSLYSVRNPQTSDIPLIADYIISNKITNLPSKLRNNLQLFIALANKNYERLFSLNFDASLYERIASKITAELYSSLGMYIANNKISIMDIPKTLRNSSEIINMLIELAGAELFIEVLEYTKDNKPLYESINKKRLATELNLMQFHYKKIDNPLLANDQQLFEMCLDDDPMLKVPNVFSETLYQNLSRSTLEKHIARGRLSILQVPFSVLADTNFLKSIFESYQIARDEKVKLIEKAYQEGNNEFLNIIYDAICYSKINFQGDVYAAINKQKFADYIIDNHIVEIEMGALMYEEEILKRLIEKSYSGLLTIHFADEMLEKYNNEIFALFKQYDVSEKSSKAKIVEFEYNIISIICNNYAILEEENLKKLADYIAKTKDSNIEGYAASSVRLFNLLYEKDIDFLFQLYFNTAVYEEIPIEKLRKYYQKHPQSLEHIELGFALAIKNIAQDIEYTTIWPVILEIARKESTKEMTKFENLGHSICFWCHKGGYELAYDILYETFLEMQSILNIGEVEIKELLRNYIEKPGDYEEAINDLARRFYAIKKEQVATKMANLKMENIKEKYTMLDMKEQAKYAKKEKRKLVYYEYLIKKIRENNLTSEEKDLIKLLQSIDSSISNDDYLDLITNIIKGGVVISKPACYHKQDKIKKYHRLKANYESILNKIYLNNPEYQNMIIGYLLDEVKHEALRKVIDKEALLTIHEIKTLAKGIGATTSIVGNRLTFTGNFEISNEEAKLNKAYDDAEMIINKIRKIINSEMNIIFPLDTITVNEDEIKSAKYNKIKHFIDFRKVNDAKIMRMMSIFDVSNAITNVKTKAMYQKLFIDSGLAYTIPFIDIEYYNELKTIIENIEYLPRAFNEEDMTIQNLDKIIKKISLYKYTTPADDAVLGKDISYKIAYKETFIQGNHNDAEKKDRVAKAAKYTSLASKNVKSTVPFVSAEVNGIKTERYKSNDPSLLVAGIDTDACFRILGNDNDFMLYTLFNKNGIVLKITDENGNFLGRVSGFRNGNTLYFNQARTIQDVHGNIDKASNELIKKMRLSIEACAQKIIEESAKTDEPIDYILILKAYGYGDCEYLPEVKRRYLSSNYPMNVEAPDYQEFTSDSELTLKNAERGFTTDYATFEDILLLASRNNLQITSKEDIKSYDPEALYDRPRSKPQVITSSKFDSNVIDKINSINARSIYWGNTDTRNIRKQNFEPITTLKGIVAIVIGEDFYITIDNNGRINELCLEYDKRAFKEFAEYHNVILETYKSTNTKTR